MKTLYVAYHNSGVVVEKVMGLAPGDFLRIKALL
jgi:hypothetical protein